MRLISRWLAVCAVLLVAATHSSSHSVASTRGFAHLRGTSGRSETSSGDVAASTLVESATGPLMPGSVMSEAAGTDAVLVQTGAKVTDEEEEEEEADEPQELDQAYMAQVLNAPLLSAGGPPANKRALPLVPVDPMEYKGGVKPIHLGIDPDVVDKVYDTNPADTSLLQTAAAGDGVELDMHVAVEGPLADAESELEADLVKATSEAAGLGDTETNILNGAPRPNGLWTRFPAHDATPLPPVDPQSAPGGVVRMGFDDVRPMQAKKGLFGMFGFLEVSAARHRAARAHAAVARSFSVAGKLSSIPTRTHHRATSEPGAITAEQNRFRQRSSASHGAARGHASAHHKAHHRVQFAAPGPGEELHPWGLEQLQDPMGDKKRRIEEQHALLEQQRQAWKAAMKRQEVMRKAGEAVEHRSSDTHAQTDAASGDAEPRFRAMRTQMIPTMAQQQQPQQQMPQQQMPQQQMPQQQMPQQQMPQQQIPMTMPSLSASSALPDDLSTTSMPDDASFQQFRSVLDMGIASPLPPGITASSSSPMQMQAPGMQMQAPGMQMQAPGMQMQQQAQLSMPLAPPNGLTGVATDLADNTLAGLHALQLPAALKEKLAAAMHVATPIAAGMQMQQQQRPMSFAYGQQQQQQQMMTGPGAPSPFQQHVTAAASRLSPGQIQQQIVAQMQQMQQRQQQQMRHAETPVPRQQPPAQSAPATAETARFRQQSASSASSAASHAHPEATVATDSFRVGMSPDHVNLIHQHVHETASPASQRAFRDILADVGLRAGSMEPSV